MPLDGEGLPAEVLDAPVEEAEVQEEVVAPEPAPEPEKPLPDDDAIVSRVVAKMSERPQRYSSEISVISSQISRAEDRLKQIDAMIDADSFDNRRAQLDVEDERRDVKAEIRTYRQKAEEYRQAAYREENSINAANMIKKYSDSICSKDPSLKGRELEVRGIVLDDAAQFVSISDAEAIAFLKGRLPRASSPQKRAPVTQARIAPSTSPSTRAVAEVKPKAAKVPEEVIQMHPNFAKYSPAFQKDCIDEYTQLTKKGK